VFTFILPVAFLTTVPAEAMLGRATNGWLAGARVTAMVFIDTLAFVTCRAYFVGTRNEHREFDDRTTARRESGFQRPGHSM